MKTPYIETLLSISIIATLSLALVGIYNQSIEAQNNTDNLTNSTLSTNSSNTLDTFRAQGQISSLASDTLAGRIDNSSENAIWVLGGDWEFNVVDDNLTNFVVDIKMTQVNGMDAHQHSIEKLNNASGMSIGSQQPLELDLMAGKPSSKITLVNGNTTMFRGTADLTANENIEWQSVPIHVTLFNGNVLNIGLDASKTEDHFKGLPVFGTVQSIIDKNGKELLNK